MKKCNLFLSLPDSLVLEIKEHVEKHGQTLSGFFRIAAEEKLLRGSSNEN